MAIRGLPPLSDPARSSKASRPPRQYAKVFAIGGGVLLALVLVLAVFLFWASTKPDSGVRDAENMEPYALHYLASNRILQPDENLICYYDATLRMNGREAAILTDRRILYHEKGKTQAIRLKDIQRIDHEVSRIDGDRIGITDAAGQRMIIRIAPLNGGGRFHQALTRARETAVSTAGGR